MRDRTKARNYSPEREEFRREHERRRKWGLMYRHAEKLRRLDDRAREQELPGWLHADRQDHRHDPTGCRTSDPARVERNHPAPISPSTAAPTGAARVNALPRPGASAGTRVPAGMGVAANSDGSPNTTTPANGSVSTSTPANSDGSPSTNAAADQDHRVARSAHDQAGASADQDGTRDRGADGGEDVADHLTAIKRATLTNPPTSTHRQHNRPTRGTSPGPARRHPPHYLTACSPCAPRRSPALDHSREGTTGRSPPQPVIPFRHRPHRRAARSRKQFGNPSRAGKCAFAATYATGCDVRAGQIQRYALAASGEP